MPNILSPLKFQPIYRRKVWGGRTLAAVGHTLPGDDATLIGESWELADLPAAATSQGEARSVIRDGPMAGTTLHEAMIQFGPRLMGRLHPTESGDFPLLVKYLDARQNLSVQVHPSPVYARAHPEAHLKSEAWYIVEADPGAVLYKGVREGVTPDQFRAAIESGDAGAVTALLIAAPARRGDCHYLPSGTCHALGAGIVVAEVQTPSDTTFRVFDWGRTDRELHVDEAMQCIQFSPPNVAHHEKRTHIAGVFTTVSRLCACEHFRIEKVRMTESYEQEIPYDQPTVWMVLQGKGVILPGARGSGASSRGGGEPVTFQRGETLLLPADMGDARVRLHEDTVWLEVTFPQAHAEQIA